jgi:hypothetical protein
MGKDVSTIVYKLYNRLCYNHLNRSIVSNRELIDVIRCIIQPPYTQICRSDFHHPLDSRIAVYSECILLIYNIENVNREYTYYHYMHTSCYINMLYTMNHVKKMKYIV